MSSLEEKYLNYLDFKNSDNDYKLTENGYELFENKKKGFLQSAKDYTTNTLQTYKDIGSTVLKYNNEIGTGIARGTTKLVESVGGLGLATLFSKVCKDRNCIVFKGKNPKKVKDKIYNVDGKCYKYDLINTSCNKNLKIIEFA